MPPRTAARAYPPSHTATLKPPRVRSRRRHATRDALTVGAFALMATPLAIFLADGGLAHFTSLGGALTGLGIIAGLVATTAVAIMLILSARVPLIDRAIGQDKATSLHAKLGQTTFQGLLLHAALLLLGYAVTDGLDPISEFGQLWGTRDFVLAVLGLGLLTLVAVSSIVAARRKLPYEVWHAIHLISYAAVLVSLPHQFSMGGLFNDGPAFWFWAGLFTVAFFCLVNYRMLWPLITSFQHRLVVHRVVQETPDTVSIELSGRRLDELGAQGGQYFHWRFLGWGLGHAQHPFSLSASPLVGSDGRGLLRITVRGLGRGSARLLRMRPGTRVLLEGPYGIFTNSARTRDHLVAVGIGIGTTPVRALLEEADFEPGHATIVLRGSSAAELPLAGEIERLCTAKGAQLVVLLGHRDPEIESWLPREYARYGYRLADLAPHLGDADVFVCGPQPAADLVIADAHAAGVKADQVHNERFDW